MAHDFRSEEEIKAIIEEMQRLNYPAGLLIEFAYSRNFRSGDVRFVKAGHFRQSNAFPEFYLYGDKVSTNEWVPVSQDIYDKIMAYIKENNLKPDDHVFEIEKKQEGVHFGHKGVISWYWLREIWNRASKNLGMLDKRRITRRSCATCCHYQGNLKCGVFNSDKPRNRDYVNIKICSRLGSTKERYEFHPRMHESTRGVSAQSKVKYYMQHCRNCGRKMPGNKKLCPKCKLRGHSYVEAKREVFEQSNWKNWAVFERYMDQVFGRKEANKKFVEDFLDLKII